VFSRIALVQPLGAAYNNDARIKAKESDARWASAAEFREETSK
jgi:hypothetical protein